MTQPSSEPDLFYYTTHGPLFGGCGHAHRTERSAATCLKRTRVIARRNGQTPDRRIHPIGTRTIPPELATHAWPIPSDGFLEERAYRSVNPPDPWRLLLAASLIDRHHYAKAIERHLWLILDEWPTASALYLDGSATQLAQLLWSYNRSMATPRYLYAMTHRWLWCSKQGSTHDAGIVAEMVLELGAKTFPVQAYKVYALGKGPRNIADPALAAAARRITEDAHQDYLS